MQKRNKIVFVAVLQLLSISLCGQFHSVFNKANSNTASSIDSLGNFSFIVSGHFHGSSGNKSTFPASTILAGIDTLNSLKPIFIMSLGDLFIDVNDTYIRNYQRSFFDKLNMPLYNAVGNHDLANGNMYENIYGPTYYKLSINDNLFVVLNTEVNDGSIEGEQLVFLKNLLDETDENNLQFNNIFLFSHRPVWSENNERYGKLFLDNTRTVMGENNFETEVKPLLTKLSKTKNIFWISGSLGSSPASFFYDRDPETNICFMQTAIRDLPRDAVLQVNLVNGKVEFKGISLTGEKLDMIENYNIEYWAKTIPDESEFNFRMIPYLTKLMLFHNYFWIGFLSSLVVLLVLRFAYFRWKRRG